MSRILLKNAILPDGITCADLLIEGNRFAKIGPGLVADGAEVIECARRYAVLPPFYNGHTHAAMAILRGYADDYDLFDWLSNYIWPMEEKMNEQDVYIGTKLAILEMIKSGTVFFNDMYWFQPGTIRAADEMGVRANVGIMVLSMGGADARTANQELAEGKVPHSDRVQISMAPHAIYTVSGEKLRECADFAKANGLPIQTHLSETKKEFDDCMAEHGMTPTAYLDSLGLLTENTTLAHAVWMTDDDLKIIADRGSVLVHNPVSNCRLGSGTFRFAEAEKAGCRIIIGTDGNSSNNNLSMFEEMKVATLLAKNRTGDPKVMPAVTAWEMATTRAAAAFGIDCGIAEGKIADCMLVDLDHHAMLPNYHLVSNLVYSADPSCIDTVICNGRILMRNRYVPGEETIIAEAKTTAADLLKR